jgi:2Fe-2S ferredoxin
MMAKAVFVKASGERLEGEIANGYSVMEAAVQLGIASIRAECGGAAACATCHVEVDAEWNERAGAPNGNERELLTLVPQASQRSRLSCQIIMREALDGIVLHVPDIG